MSSFRADLHVHSSLSDGTYTPLEILALAKEAEISGLSITDHDTIEAYDEALFASAQKLGIRILPGVEISAHFEGESVHVLGYGFSLQDVGLLELLETVRKERASRNRAILEKLSRLHVPLRPQDLPPDLSKIGRPHIAQALLQRNYVLDIKTAFDRYLGDKGLAFVPFLGVECRVVIDTLHQAKGKAVLAHPHFIQAPFCEKLLSLPFDGLEVHYGRLFPEQERRFAEMAETRGLIATGGSDFHGLFKPSIPLGASWVTQEIFERLLW